MAKNFFVLDEENNTIWQGREKDDCPQAFDTFDAAEKRAREYAKSEPGKEIRVVGVLATVKCAVSEPATKKLHCPKF